MLAGMPAPASVDLTPLWQREVVLAGSYTYGPEPAAGGRHSFDLAFELAEAWGCNDCSQPLTRSNGPPKRSSTPPSPADGAP